MPEIAFNLEKTDQEKIAFIIRLTEIEKKDGLVKFLPVERLLYQATLKKLATIKDKDALTLLINEEVHFQGLNGLRQNSETLPFNKIHVRASQVEKVLKELAATGKVFFKSKSVLIDLFTPVEFFCIADKIEEQMIIRARCLWNGKEIALQDNELLMQGPPHAFLKDRIVRFLRVKEGEIEWKLLKPLLVEDGKYPLNKSADALAKYQDQNFRLIINDPSLLTQEIKQPEVFPLLVLKDRTGGFANLLMDYGHGKTSDFNQLSSKEKESLKRWEADLLETDFIKKQVDSTWYYCPLNKVAKSLTFLLECGWTILDAMGKRVCRLTDVTISVEQKRQHLLAKGTISYDQHELNLSQIVGSFNRKETFISLGQHAVGLMPFDLKEMEIGALLDGEIVGDSIAISKNNFGNLRELFESKRVISHQTMDNLRKCLDGFNSIEQTLPSPLFLGQLRPYQQLGVNWLAFLHQHNFHGLLADDMGLGKTVQLLAFLSNISANHPHLIVVPTTLIFHWRKELERFLPHLNIYIHHGITRFMDLRHCESYDLILTSYGTLRQDAALFQQLQFHCLILDEAQTIKNPVSQIAKVIYRLHADFRLSITGTPVENSLNDLWSQFHFLIPDLLGDQEEFATSLSSGESDSRYLHKIRKKIAPFILRRTKKEVAKDLPEKMEQIVYVDMSDDQRGCYEQYLSGIRSGLLQKVQLDGLKAHRMQVFESILRLRQICCHPLLIGATAMSSKLERLIEDVEQLIEEGKKVLVYSQFTSMLNLIGQEMHKKNWQFLRLDGQSKNREEIVDEFQNNTSISVFLISLKAGGVGLNLTAADYVILFDPWWNDAVENQAIDRAHRIGRKETVIAKRYIVVESIEEKILKLKAAKNQLTEELFSDNGDTLQLTEEDFAYLLS